jgi:HAD superfamily hydrolase (TIGR01509 family)
MIENVKLVIFDMDGLMFDTEMMYLKFAPGAAKELGYDIKEEILKKTVGTNHKWAFEIFKAEGFSDFPFAEFWKILDKKYSDYFDEFGVPLKKGLFDLLDFLKGINMKMAVATSSRREKAERLLNDSGAMKYFALTTFGDEILNGKPDPEIFLKTADTLNTEYKDCLVFEDSINGIKAAHSAGMIPVMIPDVIEPTQEITKLIYKKCDSLKDAIKIFSEE